MNLPQIIRQFIQKHKLTKSCILLAVSGGPDSIALLHCFSDCREEFPEMDIAVAHVDHGWREESCSEAEQLEKLMGELGIRWHGKKLDPKIMQGNLEEACRNARMDFFTDLCREYSYDGVILAHHADDQAETVLKRLLEGAGLLSCKGIKIETQISGTIYWRPFLHVRKKDIIDWLTNKKINFFNDSTNLDPQYTRGRMRTELLPYLSKNFGKEVALPLCRIGEDLDEMESFLQDELKLNFSEFIQGWAGWRGELLVRDKPLFVAKYFLRKLLKVSGFYLSRTQIDDAAAALHQGKAGKVYPTGKGEVRIDRYHAFALKREKSNSHAEQRFSLISGSFFWKSWSVEVAEWNGEDSATSGWKEIWEGKADVVIPKGDYWIGEGLNKAHYSPRSKSLDSWWTENKVPAFLRSRAPVIGCEDEIVAEFLGSNSLGKYTVKEGWKIILRAV